MDKKRDIESSMPSENRLGYEIAIVEMRFRLEEQYKSISAFKSIVQQIFSAASLIVALGGALQLFNVKILPVYLSIYNWIISLAMVLYLLLIVLSIAVLFPAKVKGPTPADRNQLFQGFIWRETETEILRQQLDNYLAAINVNEPIIQKRRSLAFIISALLPLIVILLLALSLIPRTSLV